MSLSAITDIHTSVGAFVYLHGRSLGMFSVLSLIVYLVSLYDHIDVVG